MSVRYVKQAFGPLDVGHIKWPISGHDLCMSIGNWREGLLRWSLSLLGVDLVVTLIFLVGTGMGLYPTSRNRLPEQFFFRIPLVPGLVYSPMDKSEEVSDKSRPWLIGGKKAVYLGQCHWPYWVSPSLFLYFFQYPNTFQYPKVKGHRSRGQRSLYTQVHWPPSLFACKCDIHRIFTF